MKTDTFLGTPFHQATSVRNMTTWWYSWGPYTVPDVYTNIHEEMEAIRHFVSMNEMSPLPKIKIFICYSPILYRHYIFSLL